MKNEDYIRREVWIRKQACKVKGIRSKHLGKTWEILYKDKTYIFKKIFKEKPCFHQAIIIWHRNWLEHPPTPFHSKSLFILKQGYSANFPGFQSTTLHQNQLYTKTTKPKNTTKSSSPFLCSGPESCLTEVSIPYVPHRTAQCLSENRYSLPQSQRVETLGTKALLWGRLLHRDAGADTVSG